VNLQHSPELDFRGRFAAEEGRERKGREKGEGGREEKKKGEEKEGLTRCFGMGEVVQGVLCQLCQAIRAGICR